MGRLGIKERITRQLEVELDEDNDICFNLRFQIGDHDWDSEHIWLEPDKARYLITVLEKCLNEMGA